MARRYLPCLAMSNRSGTMTAVSEAFDELVAVMNRLRDPGGCPWDREQTLDTVTAYLLEEAYEVVEAAGAGDGDALREELGDLLFQIVFMARLGREMSWFDVDAVCRSVVAKMVRRHPHVFGDREVSGSAEVIRNWEAIKGDEREGRSEASALDGVPTSLPALLKAFRMTEKAAAQGFDWQVPADVVAKLREEVAELEAELRDPEPDALDRVREELGDVLFVMANLARHIGVEPETALQRSNAKFMRRFRFMEGEARDRGCSLRELDSDQLEELWEAAKAGE
jgi:MazG family protein